MTEENSLQIIIETIQAARERGASDVHIAAGHPVFFRIDGALVPWTDGKQQAAEAFAGILTERQQGLVQEQGYVEFTYEAQGLGRIRILASQQCGGNAYAVRLLPSELPKQEKLLLPQGMYGRMQARKGLLLVAGEAGSGRSTTFRALVDAADGAGAKRILTMERPIEYRFALEHSMVLQCEAASDASACAERLRAMVRQDADVVALDGIDDAQVLQAAVAAAEAGHLVLVVVQADCAAAAVETFAEAFPEERRRRAWERIAGVFCGVSCQSLLPARVGGRVAAFETMYATEEIRTLIREGRMRQLPQAIQAGAKDGMRLMDDAVYELYMKSLISPETAVRCARDGAGMERKLRIF